MSLKASNCVATVRGWQLFEGVVYSKKYGIILLVKTFLFLVQKSLQPRPQGDCLVTITYYYGHICSVPLTLLPVASSHWPYSQSPFQSHSSLGMSLCWSRNTEPILLVNVLLTCTIQLLHCVLLYTGKATPRQRNRNGRQSTEEIENCQRRAKIW